MSQIQREQLTVVAEKAVLVGVELPGRYVDPRDPFSELRALARTAGARVVGELLQKRSKPRGKTYLGKGKVEELTHLIQQTGATVVIFDNDLSPGQIRTLEEATHTKIVDRSELILDIFANRATTHAAKLQVEIAQLEYTYPRLRAMWTHLGQVTGGAPVGIGTRGPGEKQIEIDRRLVQKRLRQLKSELEDIQLRKTREVAERRSDHFTVGLVGYTNAGKSTLFNNVTEGGAYEHDKLFATLSTRVERWPLGGGNDALLSDTVGFIRDLPHHLVASFKSTLEETVAAHLLLIVLDVSDPNAEMQLQTVQRTLDEIGADDQPRIILLNKVDQLESKKDLLVWFNKYPDAIAISAKSGDGLGDLQQLVLDHMLGEVRTVHVKTDLSDARTAAFLEQRAEVIERNYLNGRAEFTVRLGRRHVDQLLSRGADFTIDGMPPREALKKHWNVTSADDAEQSEDRLKQIPPHKRFYSEMDDSNRPSRPGTAEKSEGQTMRSKAS